MRSSISTDARLLNKKIDELLNGKEGRKVLRRSSTVALELVNDETVERVKRLPLKPSGRGWRKALKRKSSAFKYRFEGLDKKKGGKFGAITGINYKIKALKISHLVEGGFRHVRGKFRVKGKQYREKAYDSKTLATLKGFRNALYRSYQYLGKTGKAPSLKMTRSFR